MALSTPLLRAGRRTGACSAITRGLPLAALVHPRPELVQCQPRTFVSTSLWDRLQRSFQAPQDTLAPGLFGVHGLLHPGSFQVLAQEATEQCQKLVNDIVDTKTEPLEKIRKLDLISDVICRVVDPAELCRHVHADRRWRNAAEQVFGELSNLIFRLNANKELFEAVAPLVHDERIASTLDTESRRVVALLASEFETEGGIHLPEAERERVVGLHAEIGELSTTFVRNTHREKPKFVIPSRASLVALPRAYHHLIPEQPPHLGAHEAELVAHPALCVAVQRYAAHEGTRRAAYVASVSSDAGNVPVLHSLAEKRNQLAQLLGKESFAKLAIKQCMAGSQERVLSFLHELSVRIRPQAEKEKETLLRRKGELIAAESASGEVPPSASAGALHAWDMEWLQQSIRADVAVEAAAASLHEAGLSRPGMPPGDIHEYLNLRNAIAGLQLVAKETLGLSMVEVAMSEDDEWGVPREEVRKFVVTHETDGVMGTVYFDLFGRRDKTNGAAQYVVVCGRRVDDADGAASKLSESVPMQGESGADGSRYQLPVVALVMAYPKPASKRTFGSRSDMHVPLSLGQVETLFHEFGHALHSLLSRTTYQHVSGTRTALDFVELPSHLFERFATHPDVLKRFAVSTVTGKPMPDAAIAALLAEKHTTPALDLQLQISHALFDQAVFSDRPMAVACSSFDEATRRVVLPQTAEAAAATAPVGGPSDPSGDVASDDAAFSVPSAVDIDMAPSTLNSNAVLREIMRRHSCTAHVPGTSWQGGFIHLINYAAGYYAYLYARANAAAVWEDLFEANPLCREAGERYRRQLLARGGAEDPAESVKTVLEGREAGLGPLLRSVGIESKERA